MTRAALISQYLAMGFELIPLKPDGSKEPIPGITWAGQVKYQKRPTTPAEIRALLLARPTCNIGIITGRRSGIIVVDIDVPTEASRILGELGLPAETTTVKSSQGLHFYYRIDRHQAVKKETFYGPGGKEDHYGELLGDGQYIVAPPSIHATGHVYNFLDGKDLNALKDISQALPARLITAPPGSGTPGSGQPVRLGRPFRAPSFAIRKGLSCVRQLMERPLKVGEREKMLWLLYNLMINNGDREFHAQGVIKAKNASLANPLSDQELIKHVFSSKINKWPHNCLGVKAAAPFISCDNCGFSKEVEAQMRLGLMNDPVYLNGKLSGVEHALYNGITGQAFNLNTPRTQIAKRLGVSRSAVIRGIAKLEERGLIQPELPGIK